MYQATKYKAKKVTCEAGVFDSQREYKRYLQLKAMEDRGEITDLKRQVPYELIPKQYFAGRLKERAVTYKADFVYKYRGTEIVEDVKGYRTPEYIIKRKLMLKVHGIQIREV